LLKEAARIDLIHVPFRGAGPMLTERGGWPNSDRAISGGSA
jgi:hypothetical protein